MKKLSAAGLAVLLSLSGGASYNIYEAKASVSEGETSLANTVVQVAETNSAFSFDINSAVSGGVRGVVKAIPATPNETAVSVSEDKNLTLKKLEQIAESVQYDEATNTTILTNVKYTQTSATEEKTINIARITLVGYKPGQVLKDGDVLDVFMMEGLNASFAEKDETNTITKNHNISFKKLHVNSLVFNKNTFTNMFTDSVDPDFSQFSNLHQGFALEGFKAADNNSDFISTIDSITMPALTSLEDVTMHVNGISIINKVDDPFTITIAKSEFNGMNLPIFAKITEISENAQSEEQLAQEFNKIQDFPFKKKVFSDVKFENIVLTIDDPMLAQVQNKNISVGKLGIKFDNTKPDSIVALFDLLDFNMSSEFLTLADPTIGMMLGASLPPIINIDYTTTYTVSNQDKKIDVGSDFNLDKVLNLNTLAQGSYQCANVWDVLFVSPQGQNCTGINGLSVALKDLGVGSIAAKLAVAMTGMGAENLASFVAGSLQALTSEAKTGVPNIDAATVSLTENVIKFIEKPGTLKLTINFNPPLTAKDLETGLPENFTYDFSVEQGEKTLQELAI